MPAKQSGGIPDRPSLMDTEFPPQRIAVKRLSRAARVLRRSFCTFTIRLRNADNRREMNTRSRGRPSQRGCAIAAKVPITPISPRDDESAADGEARGRRGQDID